MRCVRSPAHLRPRTRAHKLAFTPRIVIETNSPAHAEASPHVRKTLDINRESDIHAVAGTLQTPISIHALREESDQTSTVRWTGRPSNPPPCGCWALSMVAASVIASAPSALFQGIKKPRSGAVSGECGTRTRDVSVSEIYRLLPSPLGQPTKSVIGYTKTGGPLRR